jgi:diaminopimelate epimerase
MTSRITLTKHHGLGNDFLVWIDGDEARGPELAQRWCDRRRGIGADGLLIATPIHDEVGHHWQMVLFNSDGSRAEMSGNGIRCFVQAVGNGKPGVYIVETDAGTRDVEASTTDDPAVILASVEMGEVRPGRPSPNWDAVGCHPERPVLHLDLGNPHTVVGVEDIAVVDLQTIGEQIKDVNLELVEPGPEPDAITMRVHERGAGITEACGTGACASAWAAAQWGLVPSNSQDVVVHMDGGDATVSLNIPLARHVTLTGPAAFVAAIEVDA